MLYLKFEVLRYQTFSVMSGIITNNLSVSYLFGLINGRRTAEKCTNILKETCSLSIPCFVLAFYRRNYLTKFSTMFMSEILLLFWLYSCI